MADDRIDLDQILQAFGVTREEFEALDPTGSYATARAQANAEYEACAEWYTSRMKEIAASMGMAFKVEPISRGRD